MAEEKNKNKTDEFNEEVKEKNPSKASEDKQVEEKKDSKKPESKPKKTEAVVRATNLPVSTKKAMEICRFIKGKKLGNAVRDLEEVLKLRKAVPMRGEYAHRKGKGMSGGKYPVSYTHLT
ncbi:MAG: hypothetical protein QUS12_04400, partial [Methanosarcina sp.]|nr:hypothetical protein [Methanosarcina sp.]